jgi:hypothetical protein
MLYKKIQEDRSSMKKIVLGLFIVFITIVMVGCLGPAPAPAPKGDTLTPEQLDEGYTLVNTIGQNVSQGYLLGPSPMNLMGSLNFKSTSSSNLSLTSKQLFTTKTLSAWTGPDSGGWYQATNTYADSYTDEFDPSIVYTYESNSVIKFRYFSSTNVYELKTTGTSTYTKTQGETILEEVVSTNTGGFRTSKDSNNLWSGNMDMYSEADDIQVKQKVVFSNVVENNCTGIFDCWFGMTDLFDYRQYGHYIVEYDPDNTPEPLNPYHLTGWFDTTEGTLDEWFDVPLDL